jgi:ATP adenylyltransferase
MNIGKCAGAGLSDHFHMHILPRWEGDTNFMASLAETRLIPETLDDTYNKLVTKFNS